MPQRIGELPDGWRFLWRRPPRHKSIGPDQDRARLADAVGLEKRFGRSVSIRTDATDFEAKFGCEPFAGI
jgi:hypothetical protein